MSFKIKVFIASARSIDITLCAWGAQPKTSIEEFPQTSTFLSFIDLQGDWKLYDVIVVGASGYGREVLQYVKDVSFIDREVRAKGLLDDFVSRDDNPDVIG